LVGDVFTNAARAVPERPAVALGDEALTFGQLNARANAVAAVLAEAGLRRGDRLVTWASTDLAMTPVFAAAAKLGVVFAPTNSVLGAEEAAVVIEPARPALLLVDAERAEAGKALAERLGTRSLTLEALTDEAGDADPGEPPPAGLAETDPHVIFFTSGSTGRPKGAILSHRVNMLRTHPGAQLEPRGAMVCPYPMFHMGAWTIALQQWQARDLVVLLRSADPVAIAAAVAGHRAARLNCIPAVWQRVLDHLGSPAGAKVDTSSVRLADAGTSATPVELLTAIARAFPNAFVRVFYGSTEAGSVAALHHPDIERKPGSCGPPAPLTEVRLDEGTGELWVRGPLVFDGYFEDPEATAAALVDGWYRTGDVAECDDEGYLAITGRARDVIRTGGETVAPLEVEEALRDHPGVLEVAVVGVPDATWGEVICAVVVAAPGPPPTLEDLRRHAEGRLAPFKQPRRLELVDAIPRTDSTAQVQRRVLVERLTGAR